MPQAEEARDALHDALQSMKDRVVALQKANAELQQHFNDEKAELCARLDRAAAMAEKEAAVTVSVCLSLGESACVCTLQRTTSAADGCSTPDAWDEFGSLR
jgi:hypothetical protein